MSRHRAERPPRRRTWYGRKAKPGHVFVSRRELVELLRVNLRAAELEAEAAILEARAAAMAARRAAADRADLAAELLLSRATGAGVTFNALETRGLLAEPPATESGALDEAAFTTYIDGHIWDRRLDHIIPAS